MYGGGGNAEDQIMDAERGFRVAYLLLGTLGNAGKESRWVMLAVCGGRQSVKAVGMGGATYP